jgi:AraC family transcriptional regulator
MPLQPRQLIPGTFFGSTERELRTPSFEYAERIALVPDREVPEHTHANAHFVFVVRGTYITEARNRPGLCGAATLIFNPSGTTHRDRFRSERGCFFTINLEAAVATIVEARYPSAQSLTSHELLSVVTAAHREFRGPTSFSEMILEGLGLELAGRLGASSVERDGNVPRWLLRVRDSMHDRRDKLTVGMLAAEARVHPVHLARAFRQYFDCTPGEYLRRCRIERLRELLRRSDLSLASIALEAGFADQSQMTTAFRRATGRTPRAYRFETRNDVSFSQDEEDGAGEE